VEKIHAQASDRNIDVLAVTQENDSALLRKYALDNDLPFPIIMDPDRKLISQLKAPATPTKVLISSD
jgi:peroxiredoxin